jgi:hypothetical protein
MAYSSYSDESRLWQLCVLQHSYNFEIQYAIGSLWRERAAFRSDTISLLRLTGCKLIAVALRDFCYRPRKLLQFLCILKN